MGKKRIPRWSLAVLAALTAFAQFVMAAEPCMLVHQAGPPTEHSMAADPQCESAPMDQAACVVQCLGGDESVSTLAPLFLAAIASSPATPDFTLPGTQFVPSADYPAPPCGPPLQILYCSYQS